MIFDFVKKNKTLIELLIGIALFGVVIGVFLLVFTKNKVYNTIGLVIGVITSLACAVHMAWGIEVAVSLSEKDATSYLRKYTVIRYLVMCALLAVIGLTDICSPVTLIAGFFSLKAGSYLNPFVHMITTKLFGGDNQ